MLNFKYWLLKETSQFEEVDSPINASNLMRGVRGYTFFYLPNKGGLVYDANDRLHSEIYDKLTWNKSAEEKNYLNRYFNRDCLRGRCAYYGNEFWVAFYEHPQMDELKYKCFQAMSMEFKLPNKVYVSIPKENSISTWNIPAPAQQTTDNRGGYVPTWRRPGYGGD